jgi:hypothetical protein
MENKDSLKKINESEDSTSINVSDKDLIDGQRLIIQFENSEEQDRINSSSFSALSSDNENDSKETYRATVNSIVNNLTSAEQNSSAYSQVGQQSSLLESSDRKAIKMSILKSSVYESTPVSAFDQNKAAKCVRFSTQESSVACLDNHSHNLLDESLFSVEQFNENDESVSFCHGMDLLRGSSDEENI